MSNIQLVVFDIAGTTVSDNGQVAIAFIEAFKQYGKEVSKETVNRLMGFRKKDAIRMLLEQSGNRLNGHTQSLIENIHDAFTRNMIIAYEKDTALHPLPYAETVFAQLKQWGIKIALNTGFTSNITQIILNRLQWMKNDMIDFVISSDEVPSGRPYPYMIHTIMQKLDVDNSKLVMKIGDTPVDIEEGRNAGCGLVVGITTGAASHQELARYQPDRIIDSLQELPLLI